MTRLAFAFAAMTLLAGGIPLVPSLEVSTRAVGNRFVRSRLEPAAGQLRDAQLTLVLHNPSEE